MTHRQPVQRTTDWANARDVADYGGAVELVLAEYPDDVYADQEHGEIAVPDPALAAHRSVSVVPMANEVGTWSLEYLGPGFHVQLRIARRNRQARVDGWMSPAQPIKIFLSSLLRQPVVLEAQVSESGRFEFPVAPTGACRMSFVTDRGRPPATPPFWI
jgi:hypothetical protein